MYKKIGVKAKSLKLEEIKLEVLVLINFDDFIFNASGLKFTKTLFIYQFITTKS